MQQIPDQIIDVIESTPLPSMPQVLLRLLRLAEDDHAAIDELAAVAGQDPALAAHVMIAANTGAAGGGRELKTLGQAVSALGRRPVRTIAASLAIQNVFARGAGDPDYDLAAFWNHSLQVGELARGIAEALDRPDADEAYLAGLLHDVGQLLLLGGMGGRYGALLAWSRDEEALLALEQPELGADHAAVGAWLIDQWRLSSFMADAVLFHHRKPGEIAAADLLSKIVWTAHAISGRAPVEGTGGTEFEAAAIEAMLALPAGSLAAIRRQALDRVARLAADLGIEAAPDAPTLPRSSQAPFESPRPPDRREVRAEMEAAVRDMAILPPLQQDPGTLGGEAEVLDSVRESARIFFGLGRLAFLMADEAGTSLGGAGVGGQPILLQRMSIPLDAGGSLAAATALGEGPRTTMEPGGAAAASLVDIQMARALGGDGVLYVPMRGRERLVGVMACGVSQSQHARCRKRLDWMASFARMAALAVEARRQAHARERQIEADLVSRFEQLARRVAHEAGNPLAIITNYLKIVSSRLPDDSGVRRELGILKEEIDRVASLVQQLGDLPSLTSAAGEVDVNAVIEGMAALYRESLFSSRGIALDLALAPGLAAIPGSRDQIKQILLNLWKNAAEALPAGGRLSVGTMNDIRQNGRDYIELRLSDNGPGLPEDVIRHMFQPLDPNRRPGHAGMGLSIVAALVRSLGGQITYQSSPGKGTTFAMLLPKFERSES